MANQTWTIESANTIERGTGMAFEILAMVKFAECSNPVPVNANKILGGDFEKALFDRLDAGEFGEPSYPPGSYPKYPKLLVELEADAKTKRDDLLLRSDYTQLPNSKFTTEQKAEWETYRQSLRDVTSQAGFPWEVNWPTQPV
jgi:hypothetical protein